MSTYFSLSGFEPTTASEVAKIDAAKSPAPAPGEMSYDVKKSLDMGWQIATGADKQSFNATYSTMPADVAAKVATWSAIPTPRATPPSRSALAPKIFGAVAIGGAVIALALMTRAWWPTTAQ